MSRKRFTPEQIISKLREAEILLSKGGNVGECCRQRGVSENTYYRWRKEYGGLDVVQARRLKELEKENSRLKKLVLTPGAGQEKVDLNKGTITIEGKDSKNKETGYAHLTSVLTEEFKSIKIKDSEYIFPNSHGGHLKDIRSAFQRALRKSG